MAKKQYDWEAGATLEEHSRRKHKILREYFFDYLTVRCQRPHQSRFRLAIIDGFAGGGRYRCGTAGSPLIFLEELKKATEFVNGRRAAQGFGPVEIECLLVLNDVDRAVIELLKSNVAPLQNAITHTAPTLHLRVEYLAQPFEHAYPDGETHCLTAGRYRNVLFNLDQCGHRDVYRRTLVDIMHSYPSVEVFYTFAIEALVAFLQKSEPERLAGAARPSRSHPHRPGAAWKASCIGKHGSVPPSVWCSRRSDTCAPFVSPFSDQQSGSAGGTGSSISPIPTVPARSTTTSCTPTAAPRPISGGRASICSRLTSLTRTAISTSSTLLGRHTAQEQLFDDIPRLVSESGDMLGVEDFYGHIYNSTLAHTDDVHAAIINNPDIEVITPTGGERRKANTIAVTDMLKLKAQMSFPMFFGTNAKGSTSK